jgi:hypothetical protein
MSIRIFVIGFRPSFSDSHTGKVYWEYGIRHRAHGDETLAEIGRSYNVSGWTIGRLSL